MVVDYRDSHRAPEYGRSYQKTFRELPYRRMVWGFEQDFLRRIVGEHLGSGPFDHLDFACGTGRILEFLSDQARSSVGVDVSASMLEVARERLAKAELHEADLTRNDALGERRFGLVTAFRFFPNAQATLRHEAIRVLCRHLGPDGVLVFNNHKNTSSARNRLARVAGRRGFQGMSTAEAVDLISSVGLELRAVFHTSVFPASERHQLLPIWCLRPLERVLSRISGLQAYGENLIYVAGWPEGAPTSTPN